MSRQVQLAIRLQQEWIDKADALARRLSRPGVPVTRTDALRAVLAAGFDALERERKRHGQ